MGEFRRKHSHELEIEAVKQVVEQARSVSEVADTLGINRAMLARWKMGNWSPRPDERSVATAS